MYFSTVILLQKNKNSRSYINQIACIKNDNYKMDSHRIMLEKKILNEHDATFLMQMQIQLKDTRHQK